MLIVNVHYKNTPNIGDLFCSPFHYFKFGCETKSIDCRQQPTKNDGVIIGGGGIIANVNIEKFLVSPKAIAWGVGFNADPKIYTDPKNYTRGTIFNWPNYINKFKLFGVREWNQGHKWVPCVSCLHPKFNPSQKKTIPVAVYEHFRGPINLDLPKMRNNNKNINEVIDFINSAEVLLSNSFHGCYWGTLAGAKVIAIKPCSSRMQALKYPVPFCMGLDYKPHIEKTIAYPNALEECRSINLDFARDVENLLGVEIKPLN